MQGFQSAFSRFSHPHLITNLCKQVKVKWNKKEELRAPKEIIDNALVYKIKEDNEEVPRAAGANCSIQPRIGTLQDKFMHLEAQL